MIWKLLLAHVLTDFVFQSKSIADNKLKFKKSGRHCLYLLIISILILLVSGYRNVYLLIPLTMISLIHGIIDYFKAKIDAKTDDKWRWLLFTADQLVHIISIISIIVIFLPQYSAGYYEKIGYYSHSTNWIKLSLFLTLITFGGCYFTSAVCQGLKPTEKQKKEFADLQNESLLNAGKYIGIVERVIIFGSILIGRYEIIGFLIAAKSIIRHQDTNHNNRMFTEYFLIGTFTSFIWAALFTYLYLLL